jgi:hypothetical protein
MSYIPTHLRRFVIERAASRCEYCRLSQEGQEATFHLDHIIPTSIGGDTIAENLVLALAIRREEMALGRHSAF